MEHGEIKTKSGITYNYESAKNTYSVTVSVHDRKDIASAPDTTIDDSIDVTISLTDVNDAPTITGGAPAMTILENSTAVAAYTASDEDASDTLSWSVEDNADADDGDLFQINSAGELSFKIAPNFEDKQDVDGDNTYNATVRATDGGGLYATRDVAVSVTNVNEAPTIDNGPGDGETINTDENTSTTVTIATYEASDVDAGTNLTWTLEGDDEGAFTITKDLNTGNGVLRFSNVPNFEMPTDVGDTPGNNTYVVTVKVSDGPLSVSRTLTVNVENVNEAPTITSGDMARTIVENTTVVGAYTASDVDAMDTLTWDVERDRTPFASPPLMRVQRVAEPPSLRSPERASPGDAKRLRPCRWTIGPALPAIASAPARTPTSAQAAGANDGDEAASPGRSTAIAGASRDSSTPVLDDAPAPRRERRPETSTIRLTNWLRSPLRPGRVTC